MSATSLDIDYDHWMHDTRLSALHRRSAGLEKLDAAIRRYCDNRTTENAWAVQSAFTMGEGGREGRGADPTSARDGRGAVPQLRDALAAAGLDADTYRAGFSDEMRAADDVVMAARGDLARIFENSKVVFLGSAATAGSERKTRLDIALHPVSSIQSTLTDKSSAAWDEVRKKLKISDAVEAGRKELTGVAGTLYSVVNAVFGDVVWSRIEATAIGAEIKGLIADVTNALPPWFSQVWSARSTWNAWRDTINLGVAQYDISGRQYDIATGSPQAAFSGIRSCLWEELRHSAVDAGASSLSFLTSTLMSHFDAGTFTGPIIGVVTAVAKLAHHIFYLGVQYKAALAIHLRVRNVATLDITAFQTCPLLGAYLLHCADLSTIIPMSFRYTPGWQDIVESIKRDSQGVYDSAQHLINKSPFKIIGIPKIRTGKANSKAVPIEQIPGLLPGIVGGTFWPSLGGDVEGLGEAGLGVGGTALSAALG